MYSYPNIRECQGYETPPGYAEGSGRVGVRVHILLPLAGVLGVLGVLEGYTSFIYGHDMNQV
jgi:hypothetical protein